MRYKGKKQYSTIQTEKQVQIMKNDKQQGIKQKHA